MIASRVIRDFDPEDRLYCSIAAAVLGAGALSAGASIFGASKAADAQTSAAQASIANQQAMYQSNKGILSPFINAGAGGIQNLQNWTDPTSTTNPLSSLLRLTTPGADQSAALQQTPGYQFSAQQGTRAALNALAARGLGGSPGAIAKGVGGYVSGLASNTWQNVVNALMGVQGQETGALQGLVNTGTTAGSALAGVGVNTGNQISGSLTGAGNAQAASYNAIGGAVGNAANSIPSAYLLNQLTSNNGNPAYGGNGIYGGNSSNPLAGLNPSDYGAGY